MCIEDKEDQIKCNKCGVEFDRVKAWWTAENGVMCDSCRVDWDQGIVKAGPGEVLHIPAGVSNEMKLFLVQNVCESDADEDEKVLTIRKILN